VIKLTGTYQVETIYMNNKVRKLIAV